MNILVAPNSMKGSLDAFEFARLVEKAFLDCSTDFHVRKVPVADGGDFTGEILKRKYNAETVRLEVTGPLGDIIESQYFIKNKTAIIEMADASGIKRVKNTKLNPLIATSYGTGQLIFDAIKKGCSTVLLAVGGSATVDGGMGMMAALGFQFFDEKGGLLAGNGKNLQAIQKIVPPLKKYSAFIKVISDVNNPLLGEQGAAKVFGPQKGAGRDMVNQLEKGLQNMAQVIHDATGKELWHKKGMGAAGGIALPLTAYLHAEIVPGAEFILKQLDFESHVRWSDLVITGEGKLDTQTLSNKAPFAVLQCARKFQKPVIAIAGKIEKEGAEHFDAAFSFLNEPVTLEEAMKNAPSYLTGFSSHLAKLVAKLSFK